jgi:hypothetical protein
MHPQRNDDEAIEEEACLNDEAFDHPTRDDWHEQRESGQTCEAVIHAHAAILTIRLTRT